MDPIRLPEDCASLDEVRAEIDRVDRSIIHSIAQRKTYVLAAARFKASLDEVAAPERFSAMLQTRREWAERQGLSPDMIETLYRDMVSHFISEETAHWKKAVRR
jgi:isochorismate pyruvate lyase